MERERAGRREPWERGCHHIQGQKKTAFSYSDPGGTLEKIKQPKHYLAAMKNLMFQKRSKKMLLLYADQKQ